MNIYIWKEHKLVVIAKNKQVALELGKEYPNLLNLTPVVLGLQPNKGYEEQIIMEDKNGSRI